MKSVLTLACCWSFPLFSAHLDPFSLDHLNVFYDTFVCEQKNILSEAGLTPVCTSTSGLSPLPAPPPPIPVPNPPAPPSGPANHLPIVIVNNSGLPDDEVFILLQGRVPSSFSLEGTTTLGSQIFMDFASDGVGTQHVVSVGDNGSTYTKPLSYFPASTGGTGHVCYIPKTDSFLVFISLQQALNIPVLSTGIADPAFNDPSDPYDNFDTIWDQVEGAYVSTSPNISVDATAVSFFSIPLYVYLSTPTGSSGSNCGLTQSRSSLMSYMQEALSTVPPSPENAQWSNLVLKNGSSPLRVLSPGKAMAGGFFDVNYLNNQYTYHYSYLSDIWSSAVGFYQDHTLSIEIPGGAVYSGKASGDTLVLNSDSKQVILGPITQGPPYTASTSYNIFSGLSIASSATDPADGIQVSKAFQEAIIAGIVPTTSLINASLPTTLSVFRPYYQVNPNLSSIGKTTGPWYDLYSAALHACGLIYTFAYEEPLWPEVLLSSDTLQAGTYMSITIGNTQ